METILMGYKDYHKDPFLHSQLTKDERNRPYTIARMVPTSCPFLNSKP